MMPPLREASERVRDWEEFHLPLAEQDRLEQGARCMNCGVPFCQAGIIWEGAPFGCPLHNLIPEWNDMIMAGNWSHALARLLKTNNFPEFTGRVCPPPVNGPVCAACTRMPSPSGTTSCASLRRALSWGR